MIVLLKAATVLLLLYIPFLPMLAPVLPMPFAVGIVTTGSMVPAIGVGDVAFVNRTAAVSDISVGDVIMFCCEGMMPVSHRVVELRDGGFVTMGDANPGRDPPISEGDYLGRVDYVIKTGMP